TIPPVVSRLTGAEFRHGTVSKSMLTTVDVDPKRQTTPNYLASSETTAAKPDRRDRDSRNRLMPATDCGAVARERSPLLAKGKKVPSWSRKPRQRQSKSDPTQSTKKSNDLEGMTL